MALAFSLWAAVPAWSFGEFGHQVVGALADDMLTPPAKAQVQALLGPAGGPATLASVSTWADEIRVLRPATRPWHYITLQIGDSLAGVAGADTPNVVTALERQLAILSRSDADRYAREEALKWVVHLAGDLHQPLHAGEDHDKGGNLVQVRVNRRAYALHAVWDYVLLERLRLPVDSLKIMLEREIAAAPAWVARNAQGTPARWAEETHGLAAGCYRLRGKPIPKGKKVQLDREYVDAATLTSLSQLKLAGLRLAVVLNRAFDPGAGLPPLRTPPGTPALRSPGLRDPASRDAPGASAYFAHADTLREDADPPDRGPEAAKAAPAGKAAPAPGAGSRAKAKRGRHPLARFAWSANSKVYHYSECADVKRIHAKNLLTSDIPPPGKPLHAGCPLP